MRSRRIRGRSYSSRGLASDHPIFAWRDAATTIHMQYSDLEDCTPERVYQLMLKSAYDDEEAMRSVKYNRKRICQVFSDLLNTVFTDPDLIYECNAYERIANRSTRASRIPAPRIVMHEDWRDQWSNASQDIPLTSPDVVGITELHFRIKEEFRVNVFMLSTRLKKEDPYNESLARP
jgi:hypothetical protein